MSTTLCQLCTQGPTGETGHATAVFQVEGPVPGHHIFRCSACGESWIRHYGSPEQRYAWTRYNELFETRKPMADPLPRT